MISKKLLSAVFGTKVENIYEVNAENDLHFNGGNESVYPYYLIDPITINIHELAHQVKEWMFWNDYEIVTRMRIPNIYRDEHKIDYGYEINHINNGVLESSWWINTEPEAIFRAGEWILQQTKDR